MHLCTIGIHGFEIEALLDQLAAAQVGLVLDVRRLACGSTRNGFSNLVLRKRLSSAGISYVHIPKAGHPGTLADCLNEYERYLQANRPILWDLLSHIRRASERGQTVCLICNKKNAAECHRFVLAEALLRMDPSLSAIHLPMVLDLPLISSIGISSTSANYI